jgi:hypothetical protein
VRDYACSKNKKKFNQQEDDVDRVLWQTIMLICWNLSDAFLLQQENDKS